MIKKWLLLKNMASIKARVQKPYPVYDQNQLNLIPYLWPKQLKSHSLWGRTYLCRLYKGVPPPPPPLPSSGHCYDSKLFFNFVKVNPGLLVSSIKWIYHCFRHIALRFHMFPVSLFQTISTNIELSSIKQVKKYMELNKYPYSLKKKAMVTSAILYKCKAK